MHAQWLVVGASALAASCGSTRPVPATTVPPPPPLDAPAGTVAGDDLPPPTEAGGTDAAPPEATGVRFEPVEPTASREPAPHVEILFPVMEKPIRTAKAAKYRIRLEVNDWKLGQDGAGVLLALDEHPPHVLTSLAQPIFLEQLVPEAQDLGPGPHHLFAVAVRASGETVKPALPASRAPFSLVRFHVGDRSAPAVSEPRLVYNQPRGTYSGDDAAAPVVIDFYLVDARLGPGQLGVIATVTGSQGSWSTELRRWQPVRIRGLQSGDHTVSLQLVDSQGEPVPGAGARASRTITVSRDTPAAGSEP